MDWSSFSLYRNWQMSRNICSLFLDWQRLGTEDHHRNCGRTHKSLGCLGFALGRNQRYGPDARLTGESSHTGTFSLQRYRNRSAAVGQKRDRGPMRIFQIAISFQLAEFCQKWINQLLVLSSLVQPFSADNNARARAFSSGQSPSAMLSRIGLSSAMASSVRSCS
jgi:hypothetical protein